MLDRTLNWHDRQTGTTAHNEWICMAWKYNNTQFRFAANVCVWRRLYSPHRQSAVGSRAHNFDRVAIEANGRRSVHMLSLISHDISILIWLPSTIHILRTKQYDIKCKIFSRKNRIRQWQVAQVFRIRPLHNSLVSAFAFNLSFGRSVARSFFRPPSARTHYAIKCFTHI